VKGASKSPGRVFTGAAAILLAAAFFGCKVPTNTQEPLHTVETLTGLTGQNVFLVKVNSGPVLVSDVNTGRAYSVNGGDGEPAGTPTGLPAGKRIVEPTESGARKSVSGRFTGADGEEVTRYDHPGARNFRPPRNVPGRKSGLSKMEIPGLAPSFTTYNVNDTKNFWVENAENGEWIEITATLRKQGTKCNIWVPAANFNDSSLSDNDNELTSAQIQTLAEKFDAIYDLETPVFGFEYGGGPSGNGGKDGDTMIQILVYDIYGDQTPTQTGGVLGYFWGKDFYTDMQLAQSGYNYKTNLAEIFYIDSLFTDKYPEMMYSTLVHEFQHMILFNEKYVKRGLQEAGTWYNEMLSMVAEDMIGPLIPGITWVPAADGPLSRIPLFLLFYSDYGLTDWLDGDDVLISYANAYAFGAYLARNYGGADLIKSVAGNNAVDIPSLNAALSAYGGFDAALRKYAQALVYNHDENTVNGRASFNKTVAKTIDGKTYTFTGFNIITIPNPGAGSYGIPAGYKGPAIWDADYAWDMPGYSVIVQSKPAWMNVTGDITIEIDHPRNPNVSVFLLVGDP
jgi:hypothetical protein